LARKAAGKDAPSEIFQRAVEFAEAQITITRVRRARRELLMFGRGTPDENVCEVLPDITRQLILIDRYERRALSRRRFAVRDLDAMRLPSKGEGAHAASN
jgi:hypothetical protein